MEFCHLRSGRIFFISFLKREIYKIVLEYFLGQYFWGWGGCNSFVFLSKPIFKHLMSVQKKKYKKSVVSLMCHNNVQGYPSLPGWGGGVLFIAWGGGVPFIAWVGGTLHYLGGGTLHCLQLVLASVT